MPGQGEAGKIPAMRAEAAGTTATRSWPGPVLAAALAMLPRVAEGGAIPLALDMTERVVIVAPHPDDETLGAGGLIERILTRGGSVRVVQVTAGDGFVEAVVHDTGRLRPRPADYLAYGERRLREARAAMRELGGTRIRLQQLGFPDGGLEPLLEAHWARIQKERSPTTGRTAPPYPEAIDPELAYDGTDLRRELRNLLSEADPTLVVFPDPLDRHPDHRASGLFTLLALAGRSEGRMPRLLAYLVHWPDWPPRWDEQPSTKAPRAPLEPPRDLPARGLIRTMLALDGPEVIRKRAALARYASQEEVMASLLGAFVRSTEPFTVMTRAEVEGVATQIETSRRERQRAATAPE